MDFLDFLGTFVKKIVFVVVGFIVAFPLAGTIMFIGSSTKNLQTTINPIMGLIGIIFFIIGIAMIIYAAKLE